MQFVCLRSVFWFSLTPFQSLPLIMQNVCFLQRQLFAEESDDETEEQYKPCPFPNPYMTSHPHPFMELSFELGMMGLNALPSGDNSYAKRCITLSHKHLDFTGFLREHKRRQ